MEKQEYNKLIINNELDKLANISMIDDLVKYKYLYRYLIEYLLENDIHTKIMDSKAQYNSDWIIFYIKYNILSPLLNSHLEPLLKTYNKRLLLDILLEKLSNDKRIELLHNLKQNSYWTYRIHENEIIKIYDKHGINIPRVFISEPKINKIVNRVPQKELELFNEFKKVFQDNDDDTINFYLSEFRKLLAINKERTIDDIEKLIAYKRKHLDFKLLLSKNSEGEYDASEKHIIISPYRSNILSHELSHLLYNELDGFIDANHLDVYKKIQARINSDDVIKKISEYLEQFHKRFHSMYDYFKEIYYLEIRKKYHSFNEYIKAVCKDIYENHPEMIMIDDMAAYYVDDNNVSDIVVELLEIEKEEYIYRLLRNYYSEELMLENLFDALLMGKIYDNFLNIECLSGHSGFDFIEEENLSFNECLANYDAIKNSRKATRLIDDLQSIVGSELINFLDSYIEKNRGQNYGNR